MKSNYLVLILGALLLSLAQPFVCNAEPTNDAETVGTPAASRENRVKELRDLIAFNTLKSKDLKINPKGSAAEITRLVSDQLELYIKSASYSLELAELTISDKEQLTAKRDKIVSDLKLVQSKYENYLASLAKH